MMFMAIPLVLLLLLFYYHHHHHHRQRLYSIFLPFMKLLPGHKRASSDISIGSSEDEKLSQSPSTLEAVPEKNEEFGVPKNPVMDLSNDRMAEPEISKLELNDIPNVPEEPSAEEPAKESGSNVKAQEQGDEKKIVEIKPELPSSPLNILEPQEQVKKVDNVVDPTVDNMTDIQNMKDELAPANSFKQGEEPVALPEEKPKPPTSPVKEENKGEAEDKKSSPENESPAKPRFQKKVSGSGSAANNSNIDLNLSISSFISKSKEAGSVGMQVRTPD